MLYLAIIAAVLIVAVALRFAEEHLDNGIEHHQQDQPRDEDDPDLIAAAA